MTSFFHAAIAAMLSLGAVAGLTVPTVINSTQNEEPIIVDENYFEDSYVYNSSLNVPSVNNLYFRTKEGLKKATQGQILFPDGSARIPGRYDLNIPGTYEINYSDNNGNAFQHPFNVYRNILEPGKGVAVTYEENLPATQGPGLNVDLVPSSSFRLNKIVNLKNFADKKVPVVTFYPMFRENADDIAAASYCTIKLVDAYDSSKFVEFYTWAGDAAERVFYAGAGSSEQNFTGLEYNPNRPDKVNCYYEGTGYNKHVTTRYQTVDAYGVWCNSSSNQDLIKNGGISFEWNLENHKISYVNSYSKLITDLDAPEVYETNPFNFDSFFTTGEVYAQFECFNFSASKFNLQIKSVLGLEGEDLKDGIVYDTEGPTITPNFLNQGQESIFISKGEKFYIPTDVTVSDYNYYGDLKTNVYYNYGRPDQVSIYYEDYFIPEITGTYALVYTAKDSYKNETTKVINLNCIYDKPFTYEEPIIESLDSGVINYLPDIHVGSRNGAVSTTVYIKDPAGKIEVAKYDLDKERYSFVPLYLGNYEITYAFSDAFYADSISLNVLSLEKHNIYFEKAPTLYPYYMNNATYSLDEFIGLKPTASGPKKVIATPYVSYDGGDYSAVTSNTLTINSDAKKIAFKFVADEKEYETEQFDVIDTGFGKASGERDYSKYFIGDYAKAEVDNSGILFTYDNQGSFTFANPISLSSFTIDTVLKNNGFNFCSFTLTDYLNPNNSIKVDIEKLDISTYKYVITERTGDTDTSHSAVHTPNENLSIFVQNKTLFIQNISSYALTLNFELATLSFNTDGGCSLRVSKLNNQTFSKSRITEQGAQIVLNNALGAFSLGDSYTLHSAIASSVLSPVLTNEYKLTVKDPSGNFVTAKDGTVLNNASSLKDYEITLTSIGQYSAFYNVTVKGSDRTGPIDITREATTVINVYDNVDPVITFSDYSTVHLKVNDTHKLRSFTITDNFTPVEKLSSHTMVVDDHYNIIANGYDTSEVKFTKAGTYYVMALAMDEYGNFGQSMYKVIVEA